MTRHRANKLGHQGASGPRRRPRHQTRLVTRCASPGPRAADTRSTDGLSLHCAGCGFKNLVQLPVQQVECPQNDGWLAWSKARTHEKYTHMSLQTANTLYSSLSFVSSQFCYNQLLNVENRFLCKYFNNAVPKYVCRVMEQTQQTLCLSAGRLAHSTRRKTSASQAPSSCAWNPRSFQAWLPTSGQSEATPDQAHVTSSCYRIKSLGPPTK